MLPDDPADVKVGVRELQGYVGELRRAKVEEYRNKGGEIRLWKGPEHGRASCTPFGEGLSFAVVSDSVLNEARVGFLSHSKTMYRCPHGRVFAFSSPGSFGVSPASRSFCGPRPLPVFCIRYRIPTTSVLVVPAARLLSLCARDLVAIREIKGERARGFSFENNYSGFRKVYKYLLDYLLWKLISIFRSRAVKEANNASDGQQLRST